MGGVSRGTEMSWETLTVREDGCLTVVVMAGKITS